MNSIIRWAKQLLYNNAVSKLVSTTVQAAIDELASLLASIGSTPSNPTPGTFLISGGKVVYTGTGYVYTVTAGTGLINGQPVTWAQQNVTLAASDPTNDRIDAFVVNASGTVSAITGTPAASPSEPSVDPTLDLQLGIAIVYAATSTPTGTALTTLYDEDTGSGGGEWTVTTSAPTRITLNSTADHYSGTHCIVATSALAGDTITMVRPAGATDFSTLFDLFSLFLKITTAWGNGRSLSVQAYNGTVKVGNAVTIIPGQNGLSNSLTTTWQGQGWLKASFAIPSGTQADRFVLTVVGGTITFRLDLVQLTVYGGVTVTSGGGISQADADARYAQRANNLSDLNSIATAIGVNAIHGQTAKTTPVDADEIVTSDSAASNAAKKVTLLNLWANYLKGKADALYQGIGSYVSTSRQVATGTGLTGGGDLSADRTLAVSYGTSSGTAAQGNDSRFTTITGNNQTGTSYTFVAGDAGLVVEGNNASAITFTIPPVSSVAWAVGTVIEVFQQGAGQITIAAGTGVTLRSDGSKVKTAAQYATIALRMRANDEWVISGDLA